MAGRKSYQAQMAAAVSSGLVKKGLVAGKHGKAEFGKSTAAFAKSQEVRDAAAAGGGGGKKGGGGSKKGAAAGGGGMKSTAVKL